MKNLISNLKRRGAAWIGLGCLMAWVLLPLSAPAADAHAPAAPAAHGGAAHSEPAAHGEAAAEAATGHGAAHHGGVPDAHNLLTQFGYSYLTAYMFCLSLCAASLYLLFLHHLSVLLLLLLLLLCPLYLLIRCPIQTSLLSFFNFIMKRK